MMSTTVKFDLQAVFFFLINGTENGGKVTFTAVNLDVSANQPLTQHRVDLILR